MCISRRWPWSRPGRGRSGASLLTLLRLLPGPGLAAQNGKINGESSSLGWGSQI